MRYRLAHNQFTCNNFVRPIRENWQFLSSIVPTSNTVCPIARPQSFRDIFHHFPNSNAPFRRHRWQCPDSSIRFSVWANRDSLQVAKCHRWPDAVWQSRIPFGTIHSQVVHIRCDICVVNFRSIGSVDIDTEWFRRSVEANVTTTIADPIENIFSIPMHFVCNRLHRRRNVFVGAASMQSRRSRDYRKCHLETVTLSMSTSSAFCFSCREVFVISSVDVFPLLVLTKSE